MKNDIVIWKEEIAGENFVGYARVSSQQLKIRGNFQIELLKKQSSCFLPIEKIIFDEEQLLEIFQIENRQDFLQIENLTAIEKRLLLLNAGKIFLDSKRNFITTFSPENVFFTYEYEVSFGFRILRDMDQLQVEEKEFEEYKVLILSILQNKYTYDQLIDTGIDVLDKEKDLIPYIEAQTPDDLYELLRNEYENLYQESKLDVIGFPVRRIKIITIIVATLLFFSIGSLIFFAYQSFTVTDQYQVRMNIYQAHYNKDPNRVIELSKSISDNDLDDTLKIVVADSLISSQEKDNLLRAFYLDSSRQIECIELLVELKEFDSIATLHSDKNKVQLYQAFYGKDYNRAIYLGENNLDLKYDAQAQIILSRAYMAVRNYSAAITIVEKIGDEYLQLEVYKTYRDDVSKNETNIELRRQVLEILDSMIETLEDNSYNIGESEGLF